MNEVTKKLSYTRVETDEDITITWNPYYQISMFAFLLLFIIGLSMNSVIGVVICLTGISASIIQFIYTLIFVSPVNKEIKSAKKTTVSGTKYSISNPLTVVIQKKRPKKDSD